MLGARKVYGLAPGSVDRTLALTVVLMLSGLVLNGFIEYNLGDAELVLPYAIILGMLGARGAAQPESGGYGNAPKL
jgi:hypothetical protein